ncbi:MAG TPA: XdhC family protein, partial [Pseudonocardiaceae bacterium]|nr:XdhC family protein [Pseudonocardiaceae bacterium]HEX5405701.1 XdhC family protein [Pseudonocardiaceae bacterium]
MRDVMDELYRRWSAGERVGLGTVVATFHSAPREPGSAMLVAS